MVQGSRFGGDVSKKRSLRKPPKLLLNIGHVQPLVHVLDKPIEKASEMAP